MSESEINGPFILHWHPRYDKTERDEGEYCDIINRIKEVNGIDKEAFSRIFKWKTRNRPRRWVDWDHFGAYDDALRSLDKLENEEKLIKLDQLPGVGIPLASTILHFYKPEEFSIIDVRTVGVINSFQYINWNKITYEHYWEFNSVLNEIKKEVKDYTLRQIDRAMFAYHKQMLSKKKALC